MKPRIFAADDFVRIELCAALRRTVPVIPVFVDGAVMPKAIELPDELASIVLRNGVEIGHSRFDADARRLIRGLEHAVAPRSECGAAVSQSQEVPIERRSDNVATAPRRLKVNLLAFAALAAVAAFAVHKATRIFDSESNQGQVLVSPTEPNLSPTVAPARVIGQAAEASPAQRSSGQQRDASNPASLSVPSGASTRMASNETVDHPMGPGQRNSEDVLDRFYVPAGRFGSASEAEAHFPKVERSIRAVSGHGAVKMGIYRQNSNNPSSGPDYIVIVGPLRSAWATYYVRDRLSQRKLSDGSNPWAEEWLEGAQARFDGKAP